MEKTWGTFAAAGKSQESSIWSESKKWRQRRRLMNSNLTQLNETKQEPEEMGPNTNLSYENKWDETATDSFPRCPAHLLRRKKSSGYREAPVVKLQNNKSPKQFSQNMMSRQEYELKPHSLLEKSDQSFEICVSRTVPGTSCNLKSTKSRPAAKKSTKNASVVSEPEPKFKVTSAGEFAEKVSSGSMHVRNPSVSKKNKPNLSNKPDVKTIECPENPPKSGARVQNDETPPQHMTNEITAQGPGALHTSSLLELHTELLQAQQTEGNVSNKKPNKHPCSRSKTGFSDVVIVPKQLREKECIRPKTTPSQLPPMTNLYQATVSTNSINPHSVLGWKEMASLDGFQEASSQQSKSLEYEDLLALQHHIAHLDGIHCFSSIGDTSETALSLSHRTLKPLNRADHIRSVCKPARSKLAVELLTRPALHLDSVGQLVETEEQFFALREVEIDTSFKPLQLPVLGKNTLGTRFIPCLRLNNKGRDWDEPIRNRDKDWRRDSFRQALGGDKMGHPPPSASKMKFGKYTKYNLDSRLMIWSKEDQTMISRERLFCQGLLISSTFCIVTVYGLGTAGRVYADALTMPRRIEIEAYDAGTSQRYRVAVDVDKFQVVFKNRPELMIAGHKDGISPALIRMLYFEYFRLEEDSECEVKKFSLGTVLKEEDLASMKKQNEEAEEIAQKRQIHKDKTVFIMKVWQEQELRLDYTRLFSAFEDFHAEILRKRREELEEAERLRQLWWKTPKRIRGKVLATSHLACGFLCVVSFFEMPDFPTSVHIKVYHPETSGNFFASLGNTLLSSFLKVKTLLRNRTEKSFRRMKYLNVISELKVVSHYDDTDRSAIQFRKFFGSPGETLLHLHSARFWHNQCQQHFKYDRWRVFDEKTYFPVHSAFDLSLSKRLKKGYKPHPKPGRMVGRGKQLCAGCRRVDGVLGIYVLRLEFHPNTSGKSNNRNRKKDVVIEGLQLDFYSATAFRKPKIGQCDAGVTHTLKMKVDDACRIIASSQNLWEDAIKFIEQEEMYDEAEVKAAEAAWDETARQILDSLKWQNILEKALDSANGPVRKPCLFSSVDCTCVGSTTLCLELKCIVLEKVVKLPYIRNTSLPKLVTLIVSQQESELRYLAYEPESCTIFEAQYDTAVSKAMILDLRKLSLEERKMQILVTLTDLFFEQDKDNSKEERLVFVDTTSNKRLKKVEDDFASQVDKLTAASVEKARNRTKIKKGNKIVAEAPKKRR